MLCYIEQRCGIATPRCLLACLLGHPTEARFAAGRLIKFNSIIARFPSLKSAPAPPAPIDFLYVHEGWPHCWAGCATCRGARASLARREFARHAWCQRSAKSKPKQIGAGNGHHSQLRPTGGYRISWPGARRARPRRLKFWRHAKSALPPEFKDFDGPGAQVFMHNLIT